MPLQSETQEKAKYELVERGGMTPEYFWEKINEYLEENKMPLRALCRRFGLPESYLQNIKNKKRNFPTPQKLIKLRGLFTDDELFEAVRSYELLPKEADSFLLELKVSKDIRQKNRLKRKMQRGVSI